MKEFLFEIPPKQLSPYKEWERKNRIKVHFAPHCPEAPWCAAHISKHAYSLGAAISETREGAVSDLCHNLKIPLRS